MAKRSNLKPICPYCINDDVVVISKSRKMFKCKNCGTMFSYENKKRR